MWHFSTYCRLGRCVLQDTARPFTTLTQVAKANLLPRRQVCVSAKTALRVVRHPSLAETMCCRFGTERYFSTSSPRLVHPVLLVILRPLTRIAGLLVGRSFRKWWQSLPNHKRQYYRGKFRENRHKLYGVAGVMLILGGIYYESHVEETPFTKRRRFILFNPEQFESISAQMFKMQVQMFEKNILPTSHSAYTTVRRVSNRLLQANRDLAQIHDKRWSITIIDDPAHNAFILPSGQIFVFTGMLKVCNNDDQLGTVLGHEMAHAVLGHSAELLSYTHFVDLFMMIVVAMVWALMPSDMTAALGQWISSKTKDILLELPYSRKLESEADQVGLELSAKACFDVRESSAFWTKMDALQNFQSNTTIEWLSTHPNHDTRAAFIEELIPKAIEQRKQLSCPALPSLDPRNEVHKFKKWLEEEQKRELEKVAVIIPVPQMR